MKKDDMDKLLAAYEHYGPKAVRIFVTGCFLYAAILSAALVFMFLIA